ncbi:hypothetical protein Bhyg_03456, partial [Pseudolycoriella hygida]
MDLSEIQNENIRKVICETIENDLQSNKFKVVVSTASEEGENNFCGSVYRISYNKSDESDNSSSLSMIVKVTAQNEARRALLRSRTLFLKEIFIYNKVLPVFRQFELSKGIIIENCFTEYPICYRTLDAELNECLLLEDLCNRGFSLINRFTEEVTADHVYLFLKALGKLHALSFALKDQQPEKFDELASNLKESKQTDDSFIRNYLNRQAENVMKILCNEEDAHLLAKAKELFRKDAIDITNECYDPELAGAASVITYGDAWQNNSMYRYDEQRKPIEVNLLDWQLSRHSTPIIDVVYFIFCCTTKELRDVHYDNFLKTYHDSLSAHIRRLGSDPDLLFSNNLMQEHLNKFGKIGMVFAIGILPIITAARGEKINLDKVANEMANNQKTNAKSSRDKFVERMKGALFDMVRLARFKGLKWQNYNEWLRVKAYYERIFTQFSTFCSMAMNDIMDLSEIQNENIRKVICETIENDLQSNKFKVVVSTASEEGENNFCGSVYRISYNKSDESDNSSSLSMIVKVTAQNEARRALLRSRTLFLKEIFIYNKVLPVFRQFELSKGIIIENCFTEYPICYRTLDAELNECLLLEDLCNRGFSLINRFTEEVTADHVYLFLKALGKLHALSFALKDQQPEKFDELASNLKESKQTDDSFIRNYLNRQAENVMKILCNEEDAHLLAKAKELFRKDAIDITNECYDPELAGAASVITYGDAWQNNSMYRYDEQRKPIEVNLLDWQLSRHSTPIIDVVYFIFCCTTKELRDVHYDNFLKTYHDSLSAHIRRLGSDPDLLFSNNLMQEHLNKFGKIGMVFAIGILPIITAARGEKINLDKVANEMANNQKTNAKSSRDKFVERMKGALFDMVRLVKKLLQIQQVNCNRKIKFVTKILLWKLYTDMELNHRSEIVSASYRVSGSNSNINTEAIRAIPPNVKYGSISKY